MKDKSLMNRQFLTEELRRTTDIHTSNAAVMTQTREDVQRIYRIFIDAEMKAPSNSILLELTEAERSDILKTLSKLNDRVFILNSARDVMISHYTQLLGDWRYRIATTIFRFFRK